MAKSMQNNGWYYHWNGAPGSIARALQVYPAVAMSISAELYSITYTITCQLNDLFRCSPISSLCQSQHEFINWTLILYTLPKLHQLITWLMMRLKTKKIWWLLYQCLFSCSDFFVMWWLQFCTIHSTHMVYIWTTYICIGPHYHIMIIISPTH